MPVFDTLQAAKELETAFTPEQAQVLIRVFAHALVDDLATKRDVADAEHALRRDIERLEAKMDSKFESIGTRFESIETRMDSDRKTLESRIAAGLTDLKAEMIKWMAGAIAFNLLGTAGLMITLIKMIPH